jgi:hypothetical protein
VLPAAVPDEDSSVYWLPGPVLVLAFGLSALLLCLAAIPPAWSRPFGFSARLVNARGALAVAGVIVLLDSAALALLLTT